MPCIRLFLTFALLPLTGCGTAPDGPNETAYPAKPIKLIVPFNAGGGTDTYARIIKKAIEDENLLPQPVVIINQGGAGATIGSRRVKEARPDGYTMMVLHDAIMSAKYAGTVTYGPEAFEPVAATGEVGMVITVTNESPYQSLAELMNAAKESPNTVSFGANLGALTHFAGLQLEELLPGSQFRFAQAGGGADRFADLKGGHIDITGFSIEEFIRFRSEGLRGLAFFGEERHAGAPDVPTAREQGFDLVSNNTFYWWMPRGTPPARIQVFASALQRAMQTPEVRQRLAEIHCLPLFITGPPLQKRLAAAEQRYAHIAPRQSDYLPNLPAIVLGMLAVVGLCLAIPQSGRSGEMSSASAKQRLIEKPRVAAVCLVLTALYVMGLSYDWLDFRLATAGFVLACGVFLAQGRLRLLPVLCVTALAMGFGLHYLFTQILVIDLP